MAHPIDSAFVNNVPPNKADIRALGRKLIYNFDDVATFRTYDLDNTKTVAVAGTLYNYDSTDLTTADDGITCIVDLAGRRFKKATVTASVNGNTFFRQTALAGGANALQVTTDGTMPGLTSTPSFVLVTPSANNTGATTIKFNGGTTLNLIGADGNALAADNLIAGRTYWLAVTSTNATILMSGATW